MNRYFPILIIGLLTAHAQPSFAMDRVTSSDEENYENECVICFEDKSSAETLKLQSCPHSFHIHCLRDWASDAQRPRNCAFCRTPWTRQDIQFIQNNSQEQPSSGLSSTASTKNPHYFMWALMAVPVAASIVYGSYTLYTYLRKRKNDEREKQSQPAKRVFKKPIHKRRVNR